LMLTEDKKWIALWFGSVGVLIIGSLLFLLTPLGRGPDTPRLAAVLACVGVLVTALLSFAGSLVTRQSNRRLAQEHADEDSRLKLDAAMRAGQLFTPTDGTPADPAAVASALLALTRLRHADLAVALLVDLWKDSGSRVSNETAILVIDAALRSAAQPNAQLVAAEVLCRNAARLDPCQSLHWPSSVDGAWDPRFGPRTKFLLLDALVEMTVAKPVNHNSLRSVAVRLYGIWEQEHEDEHVRGCVGTLIRALLEPLSTVAYKDFMQGSKRIRLEDLETAARTAKPNPDAFLAQIAEQRSRKLRDWSAECKNYRMEPGRLADAGIGVVAMAGAGSPGPDRGIGTDVADRSRSADSL
jgi:hypothetical protein